MTVHGPVCSTRRQFLAGSAAVLLAGAQPAAKPMRGIFIIMSTPFTSAKSIDFEDLANEVDFMDRCGVHGMVWPQLASEYMELTKEERMQGMQVLARAAKHKRPNLVLGVQGPNLDVALEYARAAEKLEPDALIAMPPSEGKSLNDYRTYYKALAGVTKRPFFIQTTGGAKNLVPDLALMEELAHEFPNFGYVKEEADPVIPRLTAMAKQRPAFKSLFSGAAGKGMLYEMRLGFDGTMPGAPLSDVYVRIWNLYQSGKHDEAREVFSKLLLMTNLDQQIPGVRQYVMKKRRVFKTDVSRHLKFQLTPEAIAEIDVNLAAVQRYFVA